MSSPSPCARSRRLLKAASAGALILGLVACGRSAAGPDGPPTEPEVGVITLRARPVTLQTELSGRTAASLTADVRPQVAGIVKTRRFTEGSMVRAGDVLYEIEPASYRATRDQARAALENARAAVESARLKSQRYAELLPIDGVSRQDADDARIAYKQALATVAQDEAALQTAQINLDRTQVRAPISGRIGKSSVTPGALATASQTDAFATIRVLDPIYVDVTQSSAQLLALRRLRAAEGIAAGSTAVSLKLEDGSLYGQKGRLEFAEVAVDETTGSVTLRARFANPDGTLLPGMYVRAVLDEAVNTQAVLAPQQGITRDPKGDATALVVDAQNKLEQRRVVTERSIGDTWLIASGLADGDRLVVEGLNKVRAGQAVRVAEADLKSGAAEGR